MNRQEVRRIVLATVVLGVGFLFVAGGAPRGKSRAAECDREKAALDFASEGLDNATADGNASLAAEFAREKDQAFEEYCACLGILTTSSEGVGSRAPLVISPPMGTPSFVPPRGRPVFTPPPGPPPGRPPVTPGTPPRRGRPVFTPPGPPFTPPGPPPFTPPGPIRTPQPPPTPPPTPTPV